MKIPVGNALKSVALAKRAVSASAPAVDRYRGRFQSSGKYLFIAHPECCPACNRMNGRFLNTADVAFISHPNCKCATVAVPEGLSPAQVTEWAKNPTGTIMYGWNYGVALRNENLTERNRTNTMIRFFNRMRNDPRNYNRRKIRAQVSDEQIQSVRDAVQRGELGAAKDFTSTIRRLSATERNRQARKNMANRKRKKGV